MSQHKAGPSSSMPSTNPSSSASQVVDVMEVEVQVGEGSHDSIPAYLLHGNGSDSCTRTPLPTGEALKAALLSADRRHRESRRLFVIHGLPRDMANVLYRVDAVDPAFLAAHAGKRRYRTLGVSTNWKRQEQHIVRDGWAVFEYPELIRGWTGLMKARTEDDHYDLMGDPVMKVIGGEEDDDDGLAALFCHASLWLEDAGDYLFINRPAWNRKASVTAMPVNGSLETFSPPDFEQALYEILKVTEGRGFKGDGTEMITMIEDIAYEHWLDFFDRLGSESESTSIEAMLGLYGQAMQSLERNLDTANRLSIKRDQMGHFRRPKWADLLSRFDRRVNLLSVSQRAAPQPPPPLQPAFTPPTPKRTPTTTALGFAPLPTSRKHTFHSGVPSTQPLHSASPDENKRALDRVSYLGGILIPFPIVSGILSMGDTFGPQGPLFYIFWAAAVPLAAAACLVIYADTIRKAEVWVEVAADNIAQAVVSVSPRIGVSSRTENFTETVTVEKTKTTSSWLRSGSGSGSGSGSEERSGDGNGTQDGEFVPQRMHLELEEETIGMPVEEQVQGAELDPVVYDTEEPVPGVIVQRATDGSGSKAWKRQQLGWYGAVKAIVGVYKPRKVEDIPVGQAAYEKPLKRKTQTF